jgi:hypothetical protein
MSRTTTIFRPSEVVTRRGDTEDKWTLRADGIGKQGGREMRRAVNVLREAGAPDVGRVRIRRHGLRSFRVGALEVVYNPYAAPAHGYQTAVSVYQIPGRDAGPTPTGNAFRIISALNNTLRGDVAKGVQLLGG